MTLQPRNPHLVFLAAALLPGSGHVLNGDPKRGLTFLFFIVILGWVSTHVMLETASFIGRHIGGLFVYGVSVLDAYRTARVNWEKWKNAQTHSGN